MENHLGRELRVHAYAVAVVPGLATVATHPRDLPVRLLAKLGAHCTGAHFRGLFGATAAIVFTRFRFTSRHSLSFVE